MENVEMVLKRHQRRKKQNRNLSNIFSRVLLSIIVVLSSCIYIKLDDNNYEWFKSNVLESSLLFVKANNFYQKYFGNIVPQHNVALSTVSKVTTVKKIEDYYDGYKVAYQENEAVSTIQSGLLVYYGEKEKYGNVAIVQGVDGVDIWYGGITDLNYNIYDYVEKGSIIGNSIDDYYYLLFKKDNNVLKYDEYNKEI